MPRNTRHFYKFGSLILAWLIGFIIYRKIAPAWLLQLWSLSFAASLGLLLALAAYDAFIHTLPLSFRDHHQHIPRSPHLPNPLCRLRTHQFRHPHPALQTTIQMIRLLQWRVTPLHQSKVRILRTFAPQITEIQRQSWVSRVLILRTFTRPENMTVAHQKKRVSRLRPPPIEPFSITTQPRKNPISIKDSAAAYTAGKVSPPSPPSGTSSAHPP